MTSTRIAVAAVVAIIAGAWVTGQAERGSQAQRSAAPTASRSIPSRTAAPASTGRTAGGSPFAGTSLSRSGSRYGFPSRPARPSQPRPTDIYQGANSVPDTNRDNWNRCYRYINVFALRYRNSANIVFGGGRFNPYSLLWRAATGASPLTSGSLRLAVQEPRRAANYLVRASDVLDALILAYDQEEISSREFRQRVEEQTDLIRDYAKQVRKDDILDVVDVRKNSKTTKASKAVNLDELRALSSSLRDYAVQLHESLDEYSDGRLATVVSLQHLERPSVDTLSKNIDELAKTIEKSAKKL